MGKWFLIFLSINHFFSIAQTANDTNDIALGITNYFFAYSTKLANGSNAIGPSFHLNTNGKLTIQISALIDFKKYEYYKYNHFQTDTFTELNFFLPLLFYFNYYRNNKIHCFLTSGIVIGGNYYVDENYNTNKTNGFNIIAGTGISYYIFNRLQIRACPTLRYSERNFFPGLFVDISIPFNSNKCL